MVFCRARHRNRGDLVSLFGVRRRPTRRACRSLGHFRQSGKNVQYTCDIRSARSAERSTPRATCAARRARRLPSASRAHPDPDEHGRRVGRRRSLRRPRAPRRAQELRRRRGSPGIGRHARRPPPRSRCVPPRSPRSRRGDAARMPSAMLPSISPARRGGRSEPRGPTRAAGRPATAQIRRSSSAISAIWTRAESVRAHRRLRPRTAFLFAALSLSNDTYPHVF